jgi:hypothetical protein
LSEEELSLSVETLNLGMCGFGLAGTSFLDPKAYGVAVERSAWRLEEWECLCLAAWGESESELTWRSSSDEDWREKAGRVGARASTE